MHDLNPDQLLSTTRAVRKRLDLERRVPRELLLECLGLAVQAPSGSNRQAWRFLFLTQREPRSVVAEYYRLAYDAPGSAWPEYLEGDVRGQRQRKVIESSDYLRDHLHEVPVMPVALRDGRLPENAGAMRLATFYGSVLPAVWSFMLAARARGLRTVFTTTHLEYEREVSEALNIPYDRYTQVALIPIGFVKGEDFKPAARIPLDAVVRWERW